ncbi:MAG: 30S ribosomal protein S7 [Symbiobacteriaceae bacterium]|nr:30S ribosomal protein S7 [Symbiobacteriaceae bacterium]
MPRKGPVPKREVLPDPIYGNTLVTRIINKIMLDGKRGVAQRIFYDACEILRERGRDPMEVVDTALKNIMPVLEVKARRVGGATYQVPIEVNPDRRRALGIRWLVDSSRRRSEKTMEERLAGELLDAFNSSGNAVRRREEMHRMAEANKAFAHYRW